MPETTQSLADLQAEYQEKIAKALGNAKTKLKVELELASMTFDSIVKAGEAGIWQSPTLAPILKSLGLQPAGGTEVGNGRKVKRRGRGPAKKVKAMGNETGNGKKRCRLASIAAHARRPSCLKSSRSANASAASSR